jgi:hypothetical protein
MFESEVAQVIFSQVNLVPTLLLGLCLLYWIITIIAGLDTDLVNIDTDFDVELDFDADVDADIELDTAHQVGDSFEFEDASNVEVDKKHVRRRGKLNYLQVFLIYFNFVGLPFLFTLSFLILFWWLFSVLGTYMTLTYNNILGFAIMLGMLLPALFINKWVTAPFKSFFRNFNEQGDAPLDLIGQRGIMLSSIQGKKMGFVEVVIEDDPIKVYGYAINGVAINRGDTVLLIEKGEKPNTFFVQPYKNQ